MILAVETWLLIQCVYSSQEIGLVCWHLTFCLVNVVMLGTELFLSSTALFIGGGELSHFGIEAGSVVPWPHITNKKGHWRQKKNWSRMPIAYWKYLLKVFSSLKVKSVAVNCSKVYLCVVQTVRYGGLLKQLSFFCTCMY